MSSIGDILSENQKEKLIDSILEKGCIYRMKLTPGEGVVPKKGDIDRNKYFIIIGFDVEGNAIGFVLINTLINSQLSIDIQRLQYPIYPQKYPFLEKIRYVDCSEIKSIRKEKFHTLFEARKEYGKIDEEDLRLITECVKNSPVISPKELKRFGLL